ncbi:MAG: hypothetical protein ACPGVO_17340 [Spirulinaceae cyanobacterium]
MLDITFYPHSNQEPCYVQMATELMLWLAQSEFTEIGTDAPTHLTIDGEAAQLPLVKLGMGELSNRRRFRDFFLEMVRRESDVVLTQLGDAPTKDEYQQVTYRLRKFLELLKCIENEKYQYLQRV